MLSRAVGLYGRKDKENVHESHRHPGASGRNFLVRRYVLISLFIIKSINRSRTLAEHQKPPVPQKPNCSDRARHAPSGDRSVGRKILLITHKHPKNLLLLLSSCATNEWPVIPQPWHCGPRAERPVSLLDWHADQPLCS